MKVYAISDLHLGNAVEKPMDVFGGNWIGGYWDKVRADWKNRVTEDDTVLISGDISWGMTLPQAEPDLKEIAALPGKKIMIRGNHDYWWNSLKQMNALCLSGVTFLQNNAVLIDDCIFCGTRGWAVAEPNVIREEHDEFIFAREILRLEMALKAAKNLQTDKNETIVCLIHYPPFNSRFEDSPFTELMLKYGVSTVIYGHLHGSDTRYKPVVDKRGIKYILTSCDFLNNKLLEVR